MDSEDDDWECCRAWWFIKRRGIRQILRRARKLNSFHFTLHLTDTAWSVIYGSAYGSYWNAQPDSSFFKLSLFSNCNNILDIPNKTRQMAKQSTFVSILQEREKTSFRVVTGNFEVQRVAQGKLKLVLKYFYTRLKTSFLNSC